MVTIVFNFYDIIQNALDFIIIWLYSYNVNTLQDFDHLHID